MIVKIVILIVLAVIIGLIKNYYIIIGSVISVTLFLILKKYKYTLVSILIIIFGTSILTSILVSEITKIQLLPFVPVEEKKGIYPIYRDSPDGEYYRFNNKNPNDLRQIDETNVLVSIEIPKIIINTSVYLYFFRIKNNVTIITEPMIR